jgi:hypothetical protein
MSGTVRGGVNEAGVLLGVELVDRELHGALDRQEHDAGFLVDPAIAAGGRLRGGANLVQAGLATLQRELPLLLGRNVGGIGHRRAGTAGDLQEDEEYGENAEGGHDRDEQALPGGGGVTHGA